MTITVEELSNKMRNRVHGRIEKPTTPLDAKQDCPNCRGFGWVQSERYELRWFMCPCVVELQAEFQAHRTKFDPATIGLHGSEMMLTWDFIKPNISDGAKGMEAVRPMYKRGYGFVFLWGAWGQAKTLLGKILTATAYRDGKKASYANVSSVLDNIRLAFDEQEHKTTELLRRMDWWTERQVLFLDEMDKSNDTPWALERLHQLLDQRYTKAVRGEALTVVASNKSDDTLDGYLKSRLHDRRISKVVFLGGKDAREIMPDGWRY